MKSKSNNLIECDEKDGISVLQVIGFFMMILGVVLFIIGLFLDQNTLTASFIAISFFITMLGTSFAFPSLLKGNEGLSTMRIVVFMITNVICMLLLKIGWLKDSLTAIGLNQYWMGVIAFVFGAKATQSFFESRMAVPESPKKTVDPKFTFTSADIAKLAVVQYEKILKLRFPNILSVSDAVHDLGKTDSHVISLYLKDSNINHIPSTLDVDMPDGSSETISTEIIKSVGDGTTHINQSDEISNGVTSRGSVCCLVSGSGGAKGLVTAGHVFSNGDATNYHGPLGAGIQASVNGGAVGDWIFQTINFKTDVAVASILAYIQDPKCVSFAGKEHYVVSDSDVKKTEVTLYSKISGQRKGYILDYNNAWDVEYNDGVFQRSKIILIGSTKDRDTSRTVSKKGDSGGCVYTSGTKELVGMILGGNDKFTWVLSLQEILSKNNFQLL